MLELQINHCAKIKRKLVKAVQIKQRQFLIHYVKLCQHPINKANSHLVNILQAKDDNAKKFMPTKHFISQFVQNLPTATHQQSETFCLLECYHKAHNSNKQEEKSNRADDTGWYHHRIIPCDVLEVIVIAEQPGTQHDQDNSNQLQGNKNTQ